MEIQCRSLLRKDLFNLNNIRLENQSSFKSKNDMTKESTIEKEPKINENLISL